MKIFFNYAVWVVVALTTFSAVSCEDDISDVGSGLVDTGSLANALFVDIISYNTNNDSIRSDEQVLQNAILGVYEEPVFGRTKARFISQARLGQLNPDFGGNADMDSVILRIPVFYNDAEDEIEVDTTYLYLAEGAEPSDTATIRIKRTYKLDSIYGKTDLPMTLQVREVGQYLLSQDSTYYSNPNLGSSINNISILPTVLGSAEIKNKITTYEQRASNETSAIPTVAYEVKLDKNYFKQKFIDNQNSSDLNDQASFIRNFFKGIELSVAETQGFFFNFNPNLLSLTMYYSYDNPNQEGEDDDDYEERLNKTLPLSFTSYWNTTPGYNVQVNQYEHSNRSAQFVDSFTNPNTETGDARLYLDGLDGTKTIIKIDQDQLEQIRQNVLNDDWAIIGAELNLYVDDSYNLKKPPYLFAWNSYTDENDAQNLINENFSDLYTFYNNYPISVQFNPMYDYENDPKMYTIRITDYIKSIVEQNSVYPDGKIVLSLGNFLLSPSSSFTTPVSGTNPFYNNRAFNPFRVVLHGSASEQENKRLKLKVYYTKK